ncbi:M48 family metalloprotease [Tistrella mobilis]|uniref:M48 family metalloprotease n=1 Tax=Tistrella mobilis TaxID=171437 RepID=UPI0035578BD0
MKTSGVCTVRSSFLRIAVLICFLIVSGIGAVGPASAQQRSLSFIRDAEVEHTIRQIATPLFKAADLDPNAIDIHLIRDNAINAFVGGGMHLFIFTGLLMASDNPNQIAGVIAHETGHIAGGHLSRIGGAVEMATAQAIASALLGLAIGVAGGSADAGMAIAMGGQQMAQRGMLSFSRAQENSADQAGIRFLHRAGESALGMLQFFEKLDTQNALIGSRQSPYLSTHPMAADRVRVVQNVVAQEKGVSAEATPAQQMAYDRMIAKLRGFLDPPGRTFAAYKADDTSVPARYARAIAYYRQADLDHALPLIRGLIAEQPDDPYFHELEGQMLFENGRVAEAIKPYRLAVEKSDRAPLIAVGLAQALIETGTDAAYTEAQALLENATAKDRDNATAWRLLGIAYGRADRMPQASLALAEYNAQIGRWDEAEVQATRARDNLPVGSPGQLRADDLAEYVKRQREEARANR